jgi:multiple sugar transport system permease protein
MTAGINPVTSGVPELPAVSRGRFDDGPRGSRTRSFVLTFFAIALVAAFLSPLVRALTISIKTPDQISQPNSPVWPADAATFSYQGTDYELFQVPVDGETKQLALFKHGRTASEFIDPNNLAAGPFTVQGSWRTLDRVWTFAPEWGNYAEV